MLGTMIDYTRRRRGLQACIWAVIAACLVPASALAQQFPSRPLRMVVAFAPGGATDILARALSQQLGSRLGTSVVVENRPGASGAIAMEVVAKAPADGYTLLWGSDSVVVQPLLRKDFPVDPLKDLMPLARLGTAPIVISVNKTVSARNIKELVELAKARPGGLAYGSGGNGSTQHLAGEEFKIRAGVDLVHVPYKGTGPAIIDAVGGTIQVLFTGLGEIATQVASGDLRMLAVASEARVPSVPNLPTMIESGYAGYVSGSWMGVMAPAGLPAPVAGVLTDNIIAAGQSAEFRQRATGFGMGVNPMNGAETAAFMRALSTRFQEAINKSGIKAD